MPETYPPRVVEIDYTNHRGERALRRVMPKQIYFGYSVHHPGQQWLLDAWDCGKRADRTFAMKDVHSWRPMTPPAGPPA